MKMYKGISLLDDSETPFKIRSISKALEKTQGGGSFFLLIDIRVERGD
jgi:hypothetical protein